MSLKSFDKMCENMIMGKGAEKEVFDERQNQVRAKLTIEALVVYIASVLINSVIMELLYQWCESFCAPMFLLAAICYLYWIARNAAKGSFFGVKGSKSAKYTAFILMLYCFLFSFQHIFPLLENETKYYFSDGKATDDLIFVLTFLTFFVSGMITLVLAKKYDKKTEKVQEQKQNKA